jgi:PIN domain nuclease of toxin-antitoxin system
VNLLLDTHVWLWMNGSSERLGPKTTQLLTPADQPLVVSSASVWEIAIKAGAGKLILPEPCASLLPRWLEEHDIFELPIHQRHALRTSELPFHHRDPFDRMLVAQAQIEKLTLVTADPLFRRYDVRLQWAED